ncbi:hydrolase 2, exosortase A system-associated [Thauera phenolivorans]|uniref:hydrolase 2, exosortase A system-associated n=1 Tax=Thauera phenolivorans TaxID=1792543 RepID=UPI000A5002FF|nr:hydrolase 2, exosortase A system-associated [Thauera phenolivorans]
MSTTLEAFHLHTARGFRFCVLRGPADGAAPRGTIVHVHAFAEEMNKSRRMVALAAEAWAREGWRVLQLDLGGCGDSEGEFATATWEGWLQDVRDAYDWATAQAGGPVWLWGLRLGALLACEASARLRLDCGLLLWQPVTSGKQHLQQFLRLLKAAQMVGKAGSASERDSSPPQRLARGETIEVAGYEISPALARGMEAARVEALHAPQGVHWFQLTAAGASTNTPALDRIKADCLVHGVDLRAHVVFGPAFWQTQEIEVADELLAKSRLALQGDEAVIA